MPLALAPVAEACGKIILLGEHSVVYGFPALAAGLARGLTLRASPLPDPRAPIELCVPAWAIAERLAPGTEHPVARACLEVLAHCDGPVGGWRIEGEARIPCRAGLGSSAALTVALARLALAPQTSGGEPALADVVAASLTGERVFHGNPSGIDSEVAARGGVIAFERGKPCEAVELGLPVLHLVVMPSGVPRQTGVLVAGVRARRDRFPEVVDPILAALGQLVWRGRRALREADLPTLAELANVAHALLGALGVGHPRLDRLCGAALEHGALAAKLTGAGGGGCGFALCDTPAASLALIEALRAELPELAAAPETAPFAVEVEP